MRKSVTRRSRRRRYNLVSIMEVAASLRFQEHAFRYRDCYRWPGQNNDIESTCRSSHFCCRALRLSTPVSKARHPSARECCPGPSASAPSCPPASTCRRHRHIYIYLRIRLSGRVLFCYGMLLNTEGRVGTLANMPLLKIVLGNNLTYRFEAPLANYPSSKLLRVALQGAVDPGWHHTRPSHSPFRCNPSAYE